MLQTGKRQQNMHFIRCRKQIAPANGKRQKLPLVIFAMTIASHTHQAKQTKAKQGNAVQTNGLNIVKNVCAPFNSFHLILSAPLSCVFFSVFIFVVFFTLFLFSAYFGGHIDRQWQAFRMDSHSTLTRARTQDERCQIICLCEMKLRVCCMGLGSGSPRKRIERSTIFMLALTQMKRSILLLFIYSAHSGYHQCFA